MKTLKIALKGKGKYLGMEKGCFIIRDKNGDVEHYPLLTRTGNRALLLADF